MANRFDNRGPPSKRGRMDGGHGGGNFGGNFGGGGGGYGGGGYGHGGGGGGGPSGNYMGPSGNMSTQQVEQELMRVDNNIRPNNIILMTVLNAMYPINVQIINKVCSPLGKVLRIVVFKRGSIVQSMVEFDDIPAATQAKSNLHGCDIYSGSCTLKVEFAKTDRLNVKKNDEMTWDFTDEFNMSGGMGMGGGRDRDRPVLLQEPPQGGQGNNYGGGNMGGNSGMGGPGMFGGQNNSFGGGNNSFGGGNNMRGGPGQNVWQDGGMGGGNMGGGYGGNRGGGGGNYGGNYDDGPSFGGRGASMGRGGGGGGGGGGAVCMIYGLDPDKFNCQRVFNLFCQYGNINRIMFLKNKEGTAMIELDCPDSVDRAIQNLNHSAIFGLKLRLDWSKKQYIDEVRNPHELSDGTKSYGDFSRDRY